VWPWLVQMGWGRAGWYTYRWVDRLLFPANGPSANQLLPEHQQLAVGDRVPDGPPEVDCWFTVERLEPDRLLVLRSTRHLPASWRQRGLTMDWIWSWHLSEPDHGSTRVIQRNRMRLQPVWFERAFLAAIVPADFVMARSHLRGMQRRAQASAAEVIARRGPSIQASRQQALGRSRGGLTTKLHTICDGRGRNLVTRLTRGQDADTTSWSPWWARCGWPGPAAAAGPHATRSPDRRQGLLQPGQPGCAARPPHPPHHPRA
jgi:hypothetical protein